MIAEVVKPEEQQRDTDALEEEFFSTPPEAFATEIDGWAPAPMSASNLVAMKVTIAMLACCGLSLLGFAALSETVLVHPVKLGAAHAQMPPTAATASMAPPPAAPAEAELAAPAPAAAPIAAQAALATPVALAAVVTPAPQTALAAVVTPAPAPQTALVAVVTPAPESTPATSVASVASDATAAPRVSPAAALVRRANAALGQGQAHEAQQLASQAILLDPKHARSYIVLGGARDALGDTAGVRAAFRACVERAEGPLVSTCKTLAR